MLEVGEIPPLGETLESGCGLKKKKKKSASRVSTDLAAMGCIWINYLNVKCFLAVCKSVIKL